MAMPWLLAGEEHGKNQGGIPTVGPVFKSVASLSSCGTTINGTMLHLSYFRSRMVAVVSLRAG